jgi:hypothetical protein
LWYYFFYVIPKYTWCLSGGFRKILEPHLIGYWHNGVVIDEFGGGSYSRLMLVLN